MYRVILAHEVINAEYVSQIQLMNLDRVVVDTPRAKVGAVRPLQRINIAK